MQARIWWVPAAYILVALVAGYLMPKLDTLFFVNTSLFSAETAVNLLSAIAAGMLTFTGFVFSMTFLMVQFGASAYSPRLTHYFLRDSVVRHSLGMFIATFIYALIALIEVGLPGTVIVPDSVVLAALVGIIGSVIWFLALIQHITMLQVTNVLYMVGDKGRKIIEIFYPEEISPHGGETQKVGKGRQLTGDLKQLLAKLPPVTQAVTYEGIPLAIRGINLRRLVTLARAADGVVLLHYSIGDVVPHGATILEVRGGKQEISERRIRVSFSMGRLRTISQDPKYAIRLIVDIAIRGLSPAVNDPTTAVQAIDQLEDLLRRIGSRALDVGYAFDKSGALRIVYPTPDWEDYLDLALDEIRYYGATSLQVMRQLRTMLEDLSVALPPERRGLVQHHLDRVKASIQRSFPDSHDRVDAMEIDRQGIGLSRT